MEKIFEILEHPADLKIRVFGKDLKEIFENSMKAMEENLRPEIDFSSKSEIEREIKIKSLNWETLLVDFLSEILYLSLTYKETYQKIEFLKFKEFEIEAKIFGKKVKRFGLEIKAVTYHDLEIKKTENNWQATILFDI